MIAIIDIGVGNLGAIKNMLRKVGADAQIVSQADAISAADKIILPGVGAFDEAMRRLNASGLVPLLNTRVINDNVPLIGICLGAQMLGRGSEEGDLPGLGWIPMDAIRFPGDPSLKVPHMGWNRVHARHNHPLFKNADPEIRFYFAHSYFLRCDDDGDVAGTATYGSTIAAAVAHGNIWGVQFHPEKSHRFGAAILKNFAEHTGSKPEQ